MALSAEQKAANKLARKERDRAYMARCDERKTAEEAGRALIEAEFGAEIETGFAKREMLIAARNAAIAEIDEQVAALRKRAEAVSREFRAGYEHAAAVHGDVVKRRNDALAALHEQIDAQFPDLLGAAMWSAAAWRSIAEMDCAARARATKPATMPVAADLTGAGAVFDAGPVS